MDDARREQSDLDAMRTLRLPLMLAQVTFCMPSHLRARGKVLHFHQEVAPHILVQLQVVHYWPLTTAGR